MDYDTSENMTYESNDRPRSGSEELIKEISVYQPLLFTQVQAVVASPANYLGELKQILASDLSFLGSDTSYASHDLHAFPAKFPPQLPRQFILGLTQPGDIVLDPMMGSGTTIVEAYLSDRKAIGFDIDPLAKLLTTVKTTFLDVEQASDAGKLVLKQAAHAVQTQRGNLERLLEARWDEETRQFVEYWFAEQTRVELIALIAEIERLEDERVKNFLRVVFSACIITKSGGVSLAFDLAHTRPHRAKVAFTPSGELLYGDEHLANPSARTQFLTKTLRSPLVEFQKRLQQNLKSLFEIPSGRVTPRLELADAQSLPLEPNSVDLVVTSPPYASNAIDYMRAHKFSLVWLGYTVEQLKDTRDDCIGGEATAALSPEKLPPFTASMVATLAAIDAKKGAVLQRYYSEMSRVLQNIYRVLKPNKSAVMVVATSTIRSLDIQTQNCLADIGQAMGFQVPVIGVRHLDRNRRMMPVGLNVDATSQIQQRMHEEHVIGFFKPA